MIKNQVKIPQMSPINWFFLFLIFNSSLFIRIVKIYYIGLILFLRQKGSSFSVSEKKLRI